MSHKFKKKKKKNKKLDNLLTVTLKIKYKLTFFNSILLEVKKGIMTQTLPDNLLKLQSNPFIRILRVLGGFSIITLLSIKNFNFSLNNFVICLLFFIGFLFILYRYYIYKDKIGLGSKWAASLTSGLAGTAIATKEEKLKIARDELVKLDHESTQLIHQVIPQSGWNDTVRDTLSENSRRSRELLDVIISLRGTDLDQFQSQLFGIYNLVVETPNIIFNIFIGILTLDPVILYIELSNIFLILFKLLTVVASTALFKIKDIPLSKHSQFTEAQDSDVKICIIPQISNNATIHPPEVLVHPKKGERTNTIMHSMHSKSVIVRWNRSGLTPRYTTGGFFCFQLIIRQISYCNAESSQGPKGSTREAMAIKRDINKII